MTIAAQEIPRDAWREQLDQFTREIGTAEAVIEVAGRELRDPTGYDRFALTGITYDDDDDVVVVGMDPPGPTEDYKHIIDAPQQITVATQEDGEITFDVTAAGGHRHLIHVWRAVPLADSA